MRIPKSKWPKYLLKFKELKSIFYRDCEYGSEVGVAHAHVNPLDSKYGRICLDVKSRIRNRMLMLHEVAHLIVGYTVSHKLGHSDKWRTTCLRIGGTLSPFPINKNESTLDYNKRKRK